MSGAGATEGDVVLADGAAEHPAPRQLDEGGQGKAVGLREVLDGRGGCAAQPVFPDRRSASRLGSATDPGHIEDAGEVIPPGIFGAGPVLGGDPRGIGAQRHRRVYLVPGPAEQGGVFTDQSRQAPAVNNHMVHGE